jgi:hypothetical protein
LLFLTQVVHALDQELEVLLQERRAGQAQSVKVRLQTVNPEFEVSTTSTNITILDTKHRNLVNDAASASLYPDNTSLENKVTEHRTASAEPMCVNKVIQKICLEALGVAFKLRQLS